MMYVIAATISLVVSWLDLVGRFDKGPCWGLRPESWRILILWSSVIGIDVLFVCLVVPHIVHHANVRYSTGAIGWALSSVAVLATLRSGFRSGRPAIKDEATISMKTARADGILRGVGGVYDTVRGPLLGALDTQLAARKARRTRSIALHLPDNAFENCHAELAAIVLNMNELSSVRRASINKLMNAATADYKKGNAEAAMTKLIALAFSLGCKQVIYSRVEPTGMPVDPMLNSPRWRPGLPIGS